MIVTHLVSALIIVSFTLYALLVILFQQKANEMFGRIMKTVSRALKAAVVLLLRVLRSILKDLVTLLDTLLDWLTHKS